MSFRDQVTDAIEAVVAELNRMHDECTSMQNKCDTLLHDLEVIKTRHVMAMDDTYQGQFWRCIAIGPINGSHPFGDIRCCLYLGHHGHHIYQLGA